MCNKYYEYFEMGYRYQDIDYEIHSYLEYHYSTYQHMVHKKVPIFHKVRT